MIRWEDVKQDMSARLAQHTVWAGFVFEIYEVGTDADAPFVWIIRDYEDAPKLFDGRSTSFALAEQAIFECMAEYLTRTASSFSVVAKEGELDLDSKDAGALIRTGRVTATRSDGHYRIDTQIDGGSH